jgi:hypothetical protein
VSSSLTEGKKKKKKKRNKKKKKTRNKKKKQKTIYRKRIQWKIIQNKDMSKKQLDAFA